MRNLSKDVAAKLKIVLQRERLQRYLHVATVLIATAIGMVLAAKTAAATASVTARICHWKVNYFWGLGGGLFYILYFIFLTH